MNDDLWDKAVELGYGDYCDGISYNENPYPFSEEVESLYTAWQVGWLEADNGRVEIESGYHL